MKLKISKLILAAFILSVLSLVSLAAPQAIGVVETAEEVLLEQNKNDKVAEPQATLNAVTLVGQGTQQSPYIISTVEEFNSVMSLMTQDALYSTAYYELSCNIDFNGTEIIPWGTADVSFRGHLDGKGYKISNIGFSDKSYCGVIGYMNYGSVKNLYAEYKPVSERKSLNNLIIFGGIVSNVETNSTGNDVVIENCFSSGVLCISSEESVCLGGIVGKAKISNANMYITNCCTSFEFDVQSSKDSYVGVAAGRLSASSAYNYVFENCASYGLSKVETGYVYTYSGGFCGYANKDESGWSGWYGEFMAKVNNFDNCFSIADVYSVSPSRPYGGVFLGEANKYVNISNCFGASDRTVSALNIDKSVDVINSSNLENAQYLSEKLGFDFDKKWFLSQTNKQLLPRILLKSYGAPTTLDKVSLRLDAYSGIRFYSEVESEKREYVSEYGFIATTATSLENTELTFDCRGKYVSGVSYNTDGVDIFYKKSDDVVTFTGVLIGIPKIHYDEDIVLRPYLKFEAEGETITLYGKSVIVSVNSVASAIKNDEAVYGDLDEEAKKLLETMLPAA